MAYYDSSNHYPMYSKFRDIPAVASLSVHVSIPDYIWQDSKYALKKDLKQSLKHSSAFVPY